MKIMFVCGGTAGHINPAISVASTIRKNYPEYDIVFVGSPKGMEARLTKNAGFRFIPFKAMGIQRRLTFKNICKNVKSVMLLTTAEHRAKKILKAEKPNVVVGTGGYVSGPVVLTAAKQGIKTVIQEQNAFPGVTNKILAKKVNKVLLAVEKAKDYFVEDMDYTVTGNPVRPEILEADRAAARKQLGIADNEFTVLSFGGSLGAQRVNESVAEVFNIFKDKENMHFIHATGTYGKELFASLMEKYGIDTSLPRYDVREYIDNMDICLAAADIIICRSGATTLSELQAAGKAAILIPSPNVAENHQYHNAMVMVNAGAALILEEKDLTGEALSEKVKLLSENPEKQAEIEKNAKNMVVGDANKLITDEILKLMA